jgi:hypothetical protein
VPGRNLLARVMSRKLCSAWRSKEEPAKRRRISTAVPPTAHIGCCSCFFSQVF